MQFFQKYRLAIIVSLLLFFGFSLRTYFVYQNSRQLIREGIIEQGLPLTGDTIYSEINKDILRPVFISSLMAHDTFVKDWMLSGERDTTQIVRYLSEVKSKYATVSSFLISERTRKYYYADGILKTISTQDSHDVWYFKTREMHGDFEIMLDTDQANQGRLTVFINHKVRDPQGRLMGITGVGLTLDKIASFVNGYEKKFNRHIYFADKTGKIVLRGRAQTSDFPTLAETPGLSRIAKQILGSQTASAPQRLEYNNGQHNILLNTRYIPDLGWFLLVEQDETIALTSLNKDVLMQMATSLPFMLLVLLVIVVAIQKNQNQLTLHAATDPLTGCLNRHAFLERIPSWRKRFANKASYPQVLLVDIDHFKEVNDRYGHLEGDVLLRMIASILRQETHKDEMIVRWGGEEFLLFLQRKADLIGVAERIRQLIANQPLTNGSQPISITVSIGATEWLPTEGIDQVLARADSALYQAKHGGRNQSRIL